MIPGVCQMRRLVRTTWAYLLAATGFLWIAKYRLRHSGAVIPLMFHRVLRDADYGKTHSLPGMVLREQTFRALTRYVARHYEPVNLHTFEPGTRRSRLPVVFTFDDGWIDTCTIAFPIVREQQIPLLVFICPGLLDRDTPFWPEQAVSLIRKVWPSNGTLEIESMVETLKQTTADRREQYLDALRERAKDKNAGTASTNVDRTLSWAAIVEMAAHGVTFGSHTLSHAIVTMISLDTARHEICQSKAAIEAALGKPCDAFAYPNGNWSPDTREMLERAGYKLAFTTSCGVWNENCHRLSIPRLNVCEDNVVGLSGRFSAVMFECTTSWKAWRATKLASDQESRAHHKTADVTVRVSNR